MNDIEGLVRHALRSQAESLRVEPPVASGDAAQGRVERGGIERPRTTRRPRVLLGVCVAAVVIAAGVALVVRQERHTTTLDGQTAAHAAPIASALPPAAPARPATPSSSVDAPVERPVVQASYVLVQLSGDELVWYSATGRVLARQPLGDPHGFGRGIRATSTKVVVQTGGEISIFDSSNPGGPPVRVGPYVNLPALVVADGYWAASADPNQPNGVVWRKYDWTGTPTGADTIAVAEEGSPVPAQIPYLELEHGLVTRSYASERIEYVTPTGSRVLAEAGQVVGAAEGQVLVLDGGGTLRSIDPATGTASPIASDLPRGLVADGAGAQVSPSTKQLALVIRETDADHAPLLVVIGLDDHRVRQLPLADPTASEVVWVDESTVGIGGSSGASTVDSETMSVLSTAPGENADASLIVVPTR